MPVVQALQIPIASGLYGQPNPYIQGPNTSQLSVDAYGLPHAAFDASINEFGIRMLWQKSHACPCVWYPTTMVTLGTPNPNCQTCSGLGWYWDEPVGPATVLFTYTHSPLATDEPGTPMNDKMGQVMAGNPMITIAHDVEFDIWNQAGEFDKWTELDVTWRFNSNLASNRNTTLPYPINIQMNLTGAVTTFNLPTSSVVPITGYILSGTQVIIPNSYPNGTPYVVEYYANPTYVTFKRSGSIPHARPFSGGALPPNPLPKRFRASPLDVWLREKNNY